MMRVLHVIPSIAEGHGGPSAALALMTESLSERGIAVTVATTDDAGIGARLPESERRARRSHFLEKGVELVFAPKRTEFYKFSPGLAVWLWCNVRRFDLVHIHALFSFSSVMAGWIASIRRVPFILRPLGVLARYGMSVRRPMLKRLSFAMIDGPLLTKAAAVQFTSVSERDEASALGRPMQPVVLPLGVLQPVPEDPGRLLRELGVPRDRVRLLFLSRIDPKKNVEGLLHALNLLGPRRPFLMIAGDGDSEYVAKLKDLAESLQISDSIAWLGHVEGAKKAAAWSAADIFVLASHSENFGIAAAEAMFAGLPSVLGEGIALAPDAAAAGAAILTSTEPAAIAANLIPLLDNPALAATLGAQAHGYAVEHFSIDRMAIGLEAMYAGIITSREAILAAKRIRNARSRK